MQHSFPVVDNDQIFNALEALFGPEVWLDPDMANMAKKLDDAGLTDQELEFTIDNGKLPSNFTDLFSK